MPLPDMSQGSAVPFFWDDRGGHENPASEAFGMNPSRGSGVSA